LFAMVAVAILKSGQENYDIRQEQQKNLF